MFRLRLAPFSQHIIRAQALGSRVRVPITRRHISHGSPRPSGTTRRIAIWTSSFSAISVVAAYFLWPDVSRSAPTYASAALSPAHFTPATVSATEESKTPNTRLITLTIPKDAMPPIQEGLFAPIWSIYIKDDDIQVERAYTPLHGIDEKGRMQFWIKRYSKGEVGRWLHSKQIGDKVEIRGPLKTYPWTDELWDEVIMVSG
jgi:cytochrome-b5 reductase